MKSIKNTKVLFIEARKKSSALDNEFSMFSEKAAEALSTLPKSFLIAYSVQYKGIAEMLKKFLEKNGRNAKGCIQVLGCSVLKTKEKNILLVGSGRFHALQLAIQKKNVYIYENANINKLNKSDINKILLNKKIALSKFLSSENVGILVSSKPGQRNLNLALMLRKRINKMGKKSFIFLSDTADAKEFENFNIDFWVNTACPGIAVYDDSKNVLNYNDIESILP